MKRRSFFKCIALIATSPFLVKEIKPSVVPSISKSRKFPIPDGTCWMDGTGKIRVRVAGKWKETDRWRGWKL